MPLSGPIPEGSAFFCPHCGALYSVTHSRRSKSESNIAKCVVCQQTMDKWDSTNAPIYKLIHRPEDAISVRSMNEGLRAEIAGTSLGATMRRSCCWSIPCHNQANPLPTNDT